MAGKVIAVVAALAVATVVLTGCDSGDPSTSESSHTSARQPVATLRIEALPTLTFQSAELRTVPGPNRITFVSTGGTETIVFDDPALSHVRLSAPTGPHVAIVNLEAGKRYRIHSVIPGHTEAGRHAVIAVATRTDGQ
jgi:hypothetical protein